jgi:hypothetical protein
LTDFHVNMREMMCNQSRNELSQTTTETNG